VQQGREKNRGGAPVSICRDSDSKDAQSEIGLLETRGSGRAASQVRGRQQGRITLGKGGTEKDNYGSVLRLTASNSRALEEAVVAGRCCSMAGPLEGRGVATSFQGRENAIRRDEGREGLGESSRGKFLLDPRSVKLISPKIFNHLGKWTVPR